MSQTLLQRATAAIGSPAPMPRAVLAFAHPDDEVIAVGARLGRFASALFVHVTDGAPGNEQDSRAYGFATLDQYREAREKELTRALALAGLPDARRAWLRIPDQDAAFQLDALARKIERILLEERPEVIFTHPYEGGHPDHDACAFAVHRAVASLRAEEKVVPLIIEGAFYHAGPEGIEAGCFMPSSDQTEEAAYRLSEEERQRKQALLACFTTQQQTVGNFPLDHEQFRVAPQYDFCRPPHAGPVFYDEFPWGVNSRQFCDLARHALAMEEAASRCL